MDHLKWVTGSSLTLRRKTKINRVRDYMRIAYFIHGRGRGHAARAKTLLPSLESQGWNCELYAGGTAWEVLSENYTVNQIESIMPDSSFSLFLKRIRRDFVALKKKRPDFLIADGDAPCTYAAKLLGIPVLAIGHALIFPYCKHEVSLPKDGLRKEMFKVRVATQMADVKIAVHFTNIQPLNQNTRVVQPDFHVSKEELSDDGFLLSYFRDGNGAEVLSELVRMGWRIKNFGIPVQLDGVENIPSNSELFGAEMKRASGVVGSAGSNLIFESIAMGKPLLLIHHAYDFEQAANIKYVEKEGCGYGLDIDQIDPEKIQSFTESLKKVKKSSNPLGVIPYLSDVVVDVLQQMPATK